MNDLTSDNKALRELYRAGDAELLPRLKSRSMISERFSDLLFLCNLLEKSTNKSGKDKMPSTRKIAIVGQGTFYPLNRFIKHYLYFNHISSSWFMGDYDNYVQEITDDKSSLYEFNPDVLVFFPAITRCKYTGDLTDPLNKKEEAAKQHVQELVSLIHTFKANSDAEIIVCNFALPGGFDIGSYRSTNAGTQWAFTKLVNQELGAQCKSQFSLCDIEFLSCLYGTQKAWDARQWYENKQIFAPDFQPYIARELAHTITLVRSASKKVVVLDLDNTLWGGVIGDDGLEGIEIGTTSARGEAFRDFQLYIKSLKERGFLLAVCSKNDEEKALEPFEKHPDMILRADDFVSFKANWGPKSDNIQEISDELKLGLDSFVFVDDNPAEIEIVNQFLPDVSTISVGTDPAHFTQKLQDSRFFEVKSVTAEDKKRTRYYREETSRNALKTSVTDMGKYRKSLKMQATISSFNKLDLPRITQLIGKTNQFNLTTKRRTEAEVKTLIEDESYDGFTIRLADKFGDYGLISVVIGKFYSTKKTIDIDTWLMSCRVLEREVEFEAVNEIVKRARNLGAEKVRGYYFPTPRNNMVREHYGRCGFNLIDETSEKKVFELIVEEYQNRSTAIKTGINHAEK